MVPLGESHTMTGQSEDKVKRAWQEAYAGMKVYVTYSP
jgi:hypothetical protein